MKIKDLSREELQQLLDSDGDKYEPLGMFICHEEMGNASIYTAVDNGTGEAWTEEFGSRNSATRWLHGYAATNIYGEKLEGTR